jgi:hypothetical protein
MDNAPIARFYRMIDTARPPQRADRSAAGTLPMRAVRYCEAVTSAAGYGWYVFAPMELSLLWDGADIFWSTADSAGWMPLGAAQFPHFAAQFDRAAPEELRGCSPPFLTALPEPGALQIWTGLFARTAPGWSLLVRPPANLPLGGGFAMYEGMVESDRWFGPLFTNLRLTRTDVPVRLRADFPLLQVQPVPRAAYGDDSQARMTVLPDLAAFTAHDWEDYRRTIVAPNDDPDRPFGQYAIAARKRRRAECPFAPAAATPPSVPAGAA